tara:strand:+ start:523 stop:816 length:294 start_codon:yes stop_codon:yes gene_type:complete
MNERELSKKWETSANKMLLGKKIVKIRWLSKLSAKKDFGWYKRPIILTLDDGSEIMPQMDDEGNDGGALLWVNPNETVEIEAFPGEKFTKTEVLPVL